MGFPLAIAGPSVCVCVFHLLRPVLNEASGSGGVKMGEEGVV